MAKVKLEQKFHDIREVITPGWKIDKIKLKYILRKKLCCIRSSNLTQFEMMSGIEKNDDNSGSVVSAAI